MTENSAFSRYLKIPGMRRFHHPLTIFLKNPKSKISSDDKKKRNLSIDVSLTDKQFQRYKQEIIVDNSLASQSRDERSLLCAFRCATNFSISDSTLRTVVMIVDTRETIDFSYF